MRVRFCALALHQVAPHRAGCRTAVYAILICGGGIALGPPRATDQRSPVSGR